MPHAAVISFYLVFPVFAALDKHAPKVKIIAGRGNPANENDNETNWIELPQCSKQMSHDMSGWLIDRGNA